MYVDIRWALSNSNAQEKEDCCMWSTINHTSRGARGPDQLTSPAHECQGSWRRSRVTELRSCFYSFTATLLGWRNAQITSNASSVSTNSQQLTNWFELFLLEGGRRTCRLGSRGVLGWRGWVRRVLGGCQELIRECEGWGEPANWAMRPT